MFHFLQNLFLQTNSQQGDHKCASGGGGQRGMVKDHTLTIFFGTLPFGTYAENLEHFDKSVHRN